MAGLKSNFRTFFLTHPTMKDTFGQSFHWDSLIDKPKYPAIRATVITNTPMKSHSRITPAGRSGVANIQLDIFHTDSVEAENAANAATDFLHEYSGAIGEYGDCVVTVEDRKVLPEPEAQSYKEIIEVKVRYA